MGIGTQMYSMRVGFFLKEMCSQKRRICTFLSKNKNFNIPCLQMSLNVTLKVILILCGEVAFFIQFFFRKLRWVPENSIVGHENCDNKNIADRADIC